MSDVEVVCYTAFDGWNCHVTVSDADSKTEHSVSVTREEREKYGGREVRDLVDASFRFLLSKEPKESILPRFALSEIERYFPEYREAIADRETS